MYVPYSGCTVYLSILIVSMLTPSITFTYILTYTYTESVIVHIKLTTIHVNIISDYCNYVQDIVFPIDMW